MKLYIRWAEDDPHAEGDRGYTKCGFSLAGAKEISEKQAKVFLEDRRCLACFPHHGTHVAAMSR